MTDRPLTHRFSLIAVVREAAADYLSRFGLLLITALVVFVPAGLIEAAIEEVLHVIGERADPGAITAAILATLAATLTATLGDVFYTGVVAGIVAEARGGIHHTLAEVARHLPYGRLIAIDLLFGLMVAFGIVLLIVPGVILFTWYALAAPVVKIEGSGIRAAFRRSRELVRGNFWKVLALLLPVLVIGDVLSELLGSAGHSLGGDGFLGNWLGSIFGDVVTAPFFALAAVVSTYHLIALHRREPPTSAGDGA
jgi:hypothetical protein